MIGKYGNGNVAHLWDGGSVVRLVRRNEASQVYKSNGWHQKTLAVTSREERGRSAKRRLVEFRCLRNVQEPKTDTVFTPDNVITAEGKEAKLQVDDIGPRSKAWPHLPLGYGRDARLIPTCACAGFRGGCCSGGTQKGNNGGSDQQRNFHLAPTPTFTGLGGRSIDGMQPRRALTPSPGYDSPKNPVQRTRDISPECLEERLA